MSRAEADLWKAWREGRDERAFERLVQPHLAFAAGFARRLGCGDADADDVVQRSLVSLATETRDKPGHVGMRAWLGRSVLSESRMLFRARRRREAREARAVREPAAAENPVDARDQVEALLATLDDDARRAVELRYLYDLDYREIGHVLGQSALTCRLRVFRAVSSLRRRLGSHATMLVAALPHRVGETASVSVPAAVSAAPAATANLLLGGLAMGMMWKIGGVAAGLALAAWLGWTALRPSAEVSSEVARAGDAPPPAAGLALAPPRAAAGAMGDPAPAGRAALSARAGAGEAPVVAVPLDAPIPPGTGSVAGVVRFTDGTPVAGLRLALSGSTPIASVTDAEGRFHLHGEWIANRYPSLVVVGPREYSLYLLPVEMKADERVFVDVTIERGVPFSGRVTDATTGAPVAKAFLVLRRPGAAASQQAGTAWAWADEQGRFRFEHVPADAYSLTCAAAGYEFQAHKVEVRGDPVVQDLSVGRSRALIVRIGNLPAAAVGTEQRAMFSRRPSGRDTDSYDSRGKIDEKGTLRLDAPPAGNWHLILFGDKTVPRFETDLLVTAEDVPALSFEVPAGVEVKETLEGPDGPLANARVRIGAAAVVTTDAEGRFAFPRVEPGRQIARVYVDGGEVRLRPVDVPARGPAAVELRVLGSAEVSLTTLASAVGFYEASGGEVAQGRPDARGRIRIPYLAAGSYRLGIGDSNAEQENRSFELLPGQALDLGEIRLRKFPVVPVTVTVPQGLVAPTTLWASVLRDVGGTRAGKAIGTGLIEVDGRGKGTLVGLPEGEYLVSIQGEGFAPVEMTLDVRAGITTPIPIELRKP